MTVQDVSYLIFCWALPTCCRFALSIQTNKVLSSDIFSALDQEGPLSHLMSRSLTYLSLLTPVLLHETQTSELSQSISVLLRQACAPQAEKKGHYLKPSISRELMRHAWMISTVNACLRAWYKVPFHKDLKIFSYFSSQICLTLQLALLSRSAFPKIQTYIYAALLMHKVYHLYCFSRGKKIFDRKLYLWKSKLYISPKMPI